MRAENIPQDDGAQDYYDYRQFEDNKEFELTQWQLEVSDILETLRHNLSGELLTGKGWIKMYSPLMSEEGLNMIIGSLHIRLSKILTLSDLEIEDINNMAQDVRDEIIDSLYLNFFNFQIKKTNLTTIVNIVDHTYYSALRRARMGNERASIREPTRKMLKSYHMKEDKEKKGLNF